MTDNLFENLDFSSVSGLSELVNESQEEEIKEEKIDNEQQEKPEISKPKNQKIEEKKEEIPEEEEEIEEESSNINEENTEENSKTSDNKEFSLIPYAAAFKEAGVLPDINIDEFKKATPEDRVNILINAFEEKAIDRSEQILEQYVQQMPSKLRNAFEKWSEGVDLDSAIEYANKLDKYKSIDDKKIDEDTSLAKSILLDDKIASGLTKEEAEEEIEQLIDFAKPAKKALNRLIKREEQAIETKKAKIEAEENYKKEQSKKVLEQTKNYISDLKEVIPGINITKSERELLWDSMVKIVGKDQNGNAINQLSKERLKDPLNFDIKVHYLFNATKGFTDFSKLTNTAKTNAIKELEKEFERESNKNRGNVANFNTSKKDIKTDNDIIDFFKNV